MTEAAPTLTPRSLAICGRSESAERTIAWLAKPATARNTMGRVGVRGGEGDTDARCSPDEASAKSGIGAAPARRSPDEREARHPGKGHPRISLRSSGLHGAMGHCVPRCNMY